MCDDDAVFTDCDTVRLMVALAVGWLKVADSVLLNVAVRVAGTESEPVNVGVAMRLWDGEIEMVVVALLESDRVGAGLTVTDIVVVSGETVTECVVVLLPKGVAPSALTVAMATAATSSRTAVARR